MNSYLNSKLVLFKEILTKKTSIISDREIQQFSILKKIAKKRNLNIFDINEELKRITNISNEQVSDFQIKNLAMAIQGAKLCGVKEKQIYEAIEKIKDVDGRLELVRKFQNDIKVFVDYAHTPDALLKTLDFLKTKYGNDISLVFGCGGERDKKKRPLMARIANNKCKKVYITDDNPRNENPKKIRNELKKFIFKNKGFDFGSRSLAIRNAIRNADPQEIILIAGKGHEQKQIYKNKILNISDKRIVKNFKLEIKKINKKKQNFNQNKLVLSHVLGKNKPINFNGLSIDTRSIKKDNLFLAIRGKKKDGHKFIFEALKKKAGCAVTTTPIKKKNKKVIIVKNSISFLNNFAKLKRKLSNAKIVAITGSAGKTSLKNLIKDLLQNFGKTHFSPKSFNNYLGVPISLSNLSSDDKFGIFEVGMSKGGEIRNLTKLIKPHIGIITNIGEAHLENFKNINGIAKAKSEIIENIEAGGTVILNRDDKYYNYLSKKSKAYNLKVITYGFNKNSDVRIKKIIKKNDNFSKIFIIINNKTINLEIQDLNIYNVLSSLATLKELGINISSFKKQFKNIESSDGRGKNILFLDIIKNLN